MRKLAFTVALLIAALIAISRPRAQTPEEQIILFGNGSRVGGSSGGGTCNGTISLNGCVLPSGLGVAP